MSIKPRVLWPAIAAAVLLIAVAITGTVLAVGALSRGGIPAMICSPPMPGGDGSTDCVRIKPTPAEPTTVPSPNVIGLACPDGQHWAETIHGVVCVKNS